MDRWHKKEVFLLVLWLCVLWVESPSAFSLEIYGHRGARALAPENSLPGYATAMKIGVDFVDMDVTMTQDGVVVVTHDLSLNPQITQDKRGQWLGDKHLLWIKDLTFEQLNYFDVGHINPSSEYARLFPFQQPIAGTRIPSLVDVISYVKQMGDGQLKFQIELKTPDADNTRVEDLQVFVDAVIEILASEQVIERTEIQAFDWRLLLMIQARNPTIKTAFLTSQDKPYGKYLLKGVNTYPSTAHLIAALGGAIWGVEDMQLDSRDQVQQAQDLGLKVVAWYKAKPAGPIEATLTKLLDLQVDGIITDEPHILRGLMIAKGMSVPKAI